jgi:hypothetical protein
MLAARVEPKNGPQENKKTGNFKPVALGQFQTGVDRGRQEPVALRDFNPVYVGCGSKPECLPKARMSAFANYGHQEETGGSPPYGEGL